MLAELPSSCRADDHLAVFVVILPSVMYLTLTLPCCRGMAVPIHKHSDEAEPDSHFHWVTPDESTCMAFTQNRLAVLQMARQWDLCISGDGLTHLQQIGEEAAFIPLAQVCAMHGDRSLS